MSKPMSKTDLVRQTWLATMRADPRGQYTGGWSHKAPCGRRLRCALQVLFDILGITQAGNDGTLSQAKREANISQETADAVIFLNDQLKWDFGKISDELEAYKFDLKPHKYIT